MIDFEPRSDCAYKYDYETIFADVADKSESTRLSAFRALILDDLWFVAYFVLGWKDANHPFIVEACKEIEEGPSTDTIDIWARGHGKSTIITAGETIQCILKNPEERVCIFSHKAPAAKAFLRRIKHKFETSDLLKACFPDILYANPEREAPKWSEDDGLILKRKGVYAESTLEAAGLIEGMPTGKHYTRRVYDDIMVDDYVKSPERMKDLVHKYHMSQYLTAVDAKVRVIGTFYHHNDILVQLCSDCDPSGKHVYSRRLKPVIGPNGQPVFLSEADIIRAKRDPRTYKTQYLLDPTPQDDAKLDKSSLRFVSQDKIPSELLYFMTVDPAGEKTQGSDAWAILVVGVDTDVDEDGQPDIYVLDAQIRPMKETEGIEQIVRMYLKWGFIQRLGIEKVGLSTAEIHVKNALKRKGRYVDERDGSLVLLKPKGRAKVDRIVKALEWPLTAGKICVSEKVPAIYVERLKDEMDKFPYWHDDGLDALAYVYDLIAGEEFVSRRRLQQLLTQSSQHKPRDRRTGY